MKLRLALTVLIVALATVWLGWLVISDSRTAIDDATSVADVPTRSPAPRHASSLGGGELRSTRRHVAVDPDDDAWNGMPDDDDVSVAAWIYRLCGPGLPNGASSEARYALRKFPVNEVLPSLIDLLYRADPDWNESAAFTVIGDFGADAAPWVKDVASFASDDDTAPVALWVLGRIGAAGVPFLVDAARSETALIRRYALDSISQCDLDTRAYVEVAVALLSDPDERVRADAFALLGEQRSALDLTIPALVEALRGDEATRLLAIHALDDLDEAGAPAATSLIGLLNSGAPAVRLAAAQALADLPSVSIASVPSLRALLDSDPRAYSSVARFIVRLSAAGTLEGLSSSSAQVRRAIAEYAHWVDTHHPESVGPVVVRLAAMLDDVDAVRLAALTSLDYIDGDRSSAVPALRRLAEDTTLPARERKRAALVLAQISGFADVATSALVATLNSGTSRDRVRVLQELGELGVAAASAAEDVQPLLAETDGKLRAAALDALAAMGPGAKDALPDIRAALTSHDDRVRLSAGLAVMAVDPPGDDVFEFLRTYRLHDLRGVLIRGLIRNPRPEFAELLADRVDDRDVRVGDNAIEALREISSHAIPALVRRFEGTQSTKARKRVVHALAQLGPKASATLVRLSERDDVSDSLAGAMRHAAALMK